jgi:D-sedoheptulose 7-phosphate isomerase
MQDSTVSRVQFAKTYLEGLKRCMDALPLEAIAELIRLLEVAYSENRQVFVLGNGGSASTASHMASDLGKTVLPKNLPDSHPRFRVMALTDSVAWMTAISNDLSYREVFAEQLKNWVNPEDLVIAISGSGNSANVLEGIKVAKQRGAKTVALLGFDGGKTLPLVDHAVLVKSNNYGFVEDLHMVVNHLITASLSQFLQRRLPVAAVG